MELENRQLLGLQFVFSMIAWSGIAVALVAPRLATLEPRHALRILIAPQMFRIVGATLLANNVARPGLDPDFTKWLAIGDGVTAALAIITFFALGRPGRLGLALAALTTVVGFVDLVRNVVVGMRTNAPEHLGAGWYVVAFVVPLMVVAHVAAARRLARRQLWLVDSRVT